jgi:peptidoglycan biosynthesis protein MviN/MurJ (putative lipid II flippase)
VIGAIALACVLMVTVLAPGLLPHLPVEARRAFLAEHRLAWTLSWLAWMASALGLLFFCFCFAEHLNRGAARWLALAVVALGIPLDLAAETIYAFVLPTLASGATWPHSKHWRCWR